MLLSKSKVIGPRSGPSGVVASLRYNQLGVYGVVGTLIWVLPTRVKGSGLLPNVNLSNFPPHFQEALAAVLRPGAALGTFLEGFEHELEKRRASGKGYPGEGGQYFFSARSCGFL